MKTVFFYGWFMDESLLKDKGLSPCNTRTAYLEGYGLRIGARATMVKAENACSHGTLMELSNDELHTLYSDPSVADYRPVSLAATEADGSKSQCVSYVLPEDKLAGRNKPYANTLAEIAAKIGLPLQYIEEIKSWSE